MTDAERFVIKYHLSADDYASYAATVSQHELRTAVIDRSGITVSVNGSE
jgi:hypothetical protein